MALDSSKTAKGKLFWDDGESRDTVKNNKFYINTFDFRNVSPSVKSVYPF